MKVLILHPDLEKLGGIETYVAKLLKHTSLEVDSLVMARRPGEKGMLTSWSRLVEDERRCKKALREKEYDLVHVNPSFSARGFLREGRLLHLARKEGLKTLLFVHGWQKPFERFVRGPGRPLFRWATAAADGVVVLASEFEKAFRELGYPGPIYREVTVVDDETLEGFDLERAMQARLQQAPREAIFVSRIMKEKGIYLAIDAIRSCRKEGQAVKLVVVGDGPELESARAYAGQQDPEAVVFEGRVTPQRVSEMLRSASLFLFPTLHGEGLPNVIVEAMAVGLPVVTRPVGGIADFFRQGEHGFASDETGAGAFADGVADVLGDEARYQAISRNNAAYAQEHFLASSAAARVAQIYEEILKR